MAQAGSVCGQVCVCVCVYKMVVIRGVCGVVCVAGKNGGGITGACTGVWQVCGICNKTNLL